MKRNFQKGQIVPIASILLIIVILFAGVSSQRWLGGIRKIEQQREADSILLVAATEQARALNAIAALNQGLSTAIERVTIVASVYTGLAVCVASVFGASYCSGPFTRLSKKLPEFIKKVRKLGKAIEKYQNNINAWATTAPSQLINVQQYLIDQSNAGTFLFPKDAHATDPFKSSKLAIGRVGSDDFKDLNDKEASIAKGGDIFKPDLPRTFNSLSSLQDDMHFGRVRTDNDDYFDVTYNCGSGGTKEWRPLATEIKALRSPTHLKNNGQTWYCTFTSAIYTKRTSFKKLLEGLESGLSGALGFPGPMALRPDFFQGRNRLALARASNKKDTTMDPILLHDPEFTDSTTNIWAISEVEITGADLQEMDFSVRLADPSRQTELWNSVGLKGLAFGGLPSLKTYNERPRRAE